MRKMRKLINKIKENIEVKIRRREYGVKCYDTEYYLSREYYRKGNGMSGDEYDRYDIYPDTYYRRNLTEKEARLLFDERRAVGQWSLLLKDNDVVDAYIDPDFIKW